MLHVAFDELMSGGTQQVLAAKVRPREREGHHVLQLIAEAERAARLVVTGAGPEAAAHVLIQQPPVHQHIKRIIRRPNADGIEAVIPGRLHLLERGDCGLDPSVARDELVGMIAVVPFAE